MWDWGDYGCSGRPGGMLGNINFNPSAERSVTAASPCAKGNYITHAGQQSSTLITYMNSLVTSIRFQMKIISADVLREVKVVKKAFSPL
jgi:hypothetical protein